MKIYNFSGVPRVILNTVRRTILQHIPANGFLPNNIEVIKLKSDFLDVDFIQLRISTLPAPNELTITCNIENSTSSIRHVTTSDCTFNISNPYPKPIRLFSLKEGEMIHFTATTTLDTPIKSAIFLSCSKCFFTDQGKFIISPRVGFDSKYILLNAIDIIRHQLETGIIKDDKIIFPNDRYTMPLLFVYYMQLHKNVKYAGAKCDHLLETQGSICYTLSDKTIKIETIMHDVKKCILKDLLLINI